MICQALRKFLIVFSIAVISNIIFEMFYPNKKRGIFNLILLGIGLLLTLVLGIFSGLEDSDTFIFISGCYLIFTLAVYVIMFFWFLIELIIRKIQGKDSEIEYGNADYDDLDI